MNIIKNKKVLKGLGQQIDLLNTLNGGVSMAQVDVAQKEDRMVVIVSVPGLSSESLHVMVDYNSLILYGMLPQKNEQAQPEVNLPLFGRVLPIPFQVDTTQIRAVYDDGQLKVILPYDEDRQQSGRIIEIERQ